MRRKLYFIKKTFRPLLEVAYFMAKINKFNFLKKGSLKFDLSRLIFYPQVCSIMPYTQIFWRIFLNDFCLFGQGWILSASKCVSKSSQIVSKSIQLANQKCQFHAKIVKKIAKFQIVQILPRNAHTASKIKIFFCIVDPQLFWWKILECEYQFDASKDRAAAARSVLCVVVLTRFILFAIKIWPKVQKSRWGLKSWRQIGPIKNQHILPIIDF